MFKAKYIKNTYSMQKKKKKKKKDKGNPLETDKTLKNRNYTCCRTHPLPKHVQEQFSSQSL